MADETQANTPATGTGSTIDEAAERISALRAKREQPTQNDPPADEADTDQDDDASGDAIDVDALEVTDPDSTGDDGDIDGDGTEEEVGDEEGDGGEYELADDAKPVFDVLPAKLLDSTIHLPVDGKLVPTTLREALRGGLRQADYTRKVQETLEERKNYVKERDNFKLVADVMVEQIEQASKFTGRTEEQWNQLFKDDPIAYLTERDAQMREQEKVKLIRQEQQRVQAEQQREQQQQQIQRIVDEGQKYAAWATKALKLADEKSLNAHKAEVLADLRTRASDEEIVTLLTDHRFLVMASEAAMYRKMVANARRAKDKQAPAASGVATLVGGKPKPSTTGAAIAEKKAIAALKKNPNSIDRVTDALAARRNNTKRVRR